MKAYALGIYPRSPKLIEATRTNDPKLDELFKKEKDKLIKVQKRHGFAYVADPMLDWNDMFRPFARVKGMELGALNRFFETNNFYRRLIVKDELRGYGKVVKNSIALELLPSNSAVSIPDPYTFAELNINEYYKDYESYLLAIAKMLNKEAQALAREGVKFIQLEAPAIAYNATAIDNFDLIKDAIEKVKYRVKSKVYLHLYFGNVARIYDRLLDLKVDGLAIDLINTKLEDVEYDSSKLGIAYGIIDAMNTKLEELSMAKMLSKAIDRMKPKEAYICPNTDLEYLPYEFAIKKLSRLASIAKRVKA